MIEPPASTQIWIAAGVTDLRRGFTGLSALVQTKLEKSPMSGQVFIFRGRRGDLVKLIWFDGDGLCLFCKRLKRGRFVWPQASEGVVHLTRAQLSMLLEGIDWHRPEPTCADVGVDAGCGFPLFFLRTRNPVRGILRVMLVPTLPDLSTLDRERLQAMLVAEHQEHIATHARLQSRESEIEHRKLLLSQLRRMQFGRKSEKLERQIEQLELRLEDLQQSRPCESAPASEGPQPSATGSTAMDTPAKPVRGALPAHLPRTTQTHLPKPTTCPDCGGELRKFGEDISEILDYLPANFVVIRYVRPKLSCGHCERIVQAPAPSRPIARGVAGPGLLAHMLVSKAVLGAISRNTGLARATCQKAAL
jgi:transposase